MRALRPVLASVVVALVAAGPLVQAQTLAPAAPDSAAVGSPPPVGMGDVGIEERLGETVSRDIAFLDSDGRRVTVGDYLDEGRPLVLAFVYHDCPMMCSLILDGFAQVLKETDLTAGEDFTALAVSFDATETPQDASPVKQRYLGIAERPELTEHWHFLTGTEEDVAAITDQTGFQFAWDERGQQFAHTAALIFVSPNGTITRYLYGVLFQPRDFRIAVVEAGSGTVGSFADQVLLYCYQYDPTTRSYAVNVARVIMTLGGVLTLAFVGVGLVLMWRRERRAVPEAPPPGPSPERTEL